MSDNKLIFDTKALISWFKAEKRNLPWRYSPSPYQVWVSEVMLQQTQVDVVIPYYNRWIERFPSIRDLADAELDKVIKAWEGLGYYSRARNLHLGAREVVKKFNGSLPNKPEELRSIKGIGPYTVGAILSFAFHQKAAAVDGNVLRVLARYFLIQDDISKHQISVKIRLMVEKLLPNQEPWLMTEGLIELGALICKRKAECHICPLQKTCGAYQENQVSLLPYKSKKKPIQTLYRCPAVIIYQNNLLIKRGKKGEIMSDLHEFPYIEIDEKGLDIEALTQKIQKKLELSLNYFKPLPNIKHSFTRYRVHLKPALFTSPKAQKIKDYNWFPIDNIQSLTFSSGHKRILNHYLQVYHHETYSTH